MDDYETYNKIIREDDLERLKSSRLPIDRTSMRYAVRANALKCLAWIIEHDYNINRTTYDLVEAISNGYYRAAVMQI